MEHIDTRADYDIFFDHEWSTLVFDSTRDNFVTTFDYSDDAIGASTIDAFLNDAMKTHDEWERVDSDIKTMLEVMLETKEVNPEEPTIHRHSFHFDRHDTTQRGEFRFETFANGNRYGFQIGVDVDIERDDFLFEDMFMRHYRKLQEEVMEDAEDR